MIVYKSTGQIFQNRKEAKIYFGTAEYNRCLERRDFIFTKTNSLAFNESINKTTI